MKIGKRKVSIMEYEKHEARVSGGLETLAGAGAVLIWMFALIPEIKDAAIVGYIGGGFLVADGGADLISGKMGYLPNYLSDTTSYIFGKIRKMKNKLNGGKE